MRNFWWSGRLAACFLCTRHRKSGLPDFAVIESGLKADICRTYLSVSDTVWADTNSVLLYAPGIEAVFLHSRRVSKFPSESIRRKSRRRSVEDSTKESSLSKMLSTNRLHLLKNFFNPCCFVLVALLKKGSSWLILFYPLSGGGGTDPCGHGRSPVTPTFLQRPETR